MTLAVEASIAGDNQSGMAIGGEGNSANNQVVGLMIEGSGNTGRLEANSWDIGSIISTHKISGASGEFATIENVAVNEVLGFAIEGSNNELNIFNDIIHVNHSIQGLDLQAPDNEIVDSAAEFSVEDGNSIVMKDSIARYRKLIFGGK